MFIFSIIKSDDIFLCCGKGGPGQPQSLGGNFSMWMLLERLRFTLDGTECNKIGVGYEAFNDQPNFCSSPFWSCLHNQLWNFREVSIHKLCLENLFFLINSLFYDFRWFSSNFSSTFWPRNLEVVHRLTRTELEESSCHYMVSKEGLKG